MTEDLRPAGAYVHGIDGPTVLVPARVAAALDLATDGFADLRARYRTQPEIYQPLLALWKVGHQYLSVGSASSATSGTELAESPEVAPASRLMNSSAAADRLGVTDRAIRKACAKGTLTATRTARGWQISEADLDTYRRNRAA